MSAQILPFTDAAERYGLHMRLSALNARRLKPTFISTHWEQELRQNVCSLIEEGTFLEQERAAVRERAAQVPSDVDGFIAWFERLRDDGPGQHDPLFAWLAQTANFDQMRWFLKQEIAGEAGFDDLVALTQLRFDDQPKLEMARNYWDEMGRGHLHGTHGGMLNRSAAEFRLSELDCDSVWEAIALGNLMAGLALNRRYAYQSVGALGVIEMTAPGRVSLVNAGLRRLGVTPQGRQYFQIHAGLDIRHSEAWNRDVLRPLVSADARTAQAIAEGALMRLRAGERCFARYRRELGVAPTPDLATSPATIEGCA
jgi:hypothetical protein